MGFFSGSKETYVSSTAYNMAGDEANRPQYLKTLVLKNILSDTYNSVSDSLRYGYLNGPGIKFRSFYRWANEHYTDIGMPSGSLKAVVSISLETVQPFIDIDEPDAVAWAQYGFLDDADYGIWIEQWFLQHPIYNYSDPWSANIDQATGEITIKNEGGFVIGSFVPDNFDLTARYFYVYYVWVKDDQIIDSTTGDTETGDPDTVAWTLETSNTTSHTVSLSTTVTTDVTYSDSTSPTHDVDTTYDSESYTEYEDTYVDETYEGSISDPGVDGIKKYVRHLYHHRNKEVTTDTVTTVDTEDIGGGVIKTTTVTTVTESLSTNNSYRIDTEIIAISEWGPLDLWIYKIGDGIEELDALVQDNTDYGGFYPFIPVRFENQFLSDSYFPDTYAVTKKAYKKATNGKIEDLIEQLEDNDKLSDIDFAYVVFGVSLNVKEQACRQYLWTFFDKIRLDQIGGESQYADWIDGEINRTTLAAAWKAWREAQSNPSDPLYGAEEPESRAVTGSTLAGNSLQITNTGWFEARYDIRIGWTYIKKNSGSGLGKPDAKVGDIWLQYIGEANYNSVIPGSNSTDLNGTRKVEQIRIYKQVDASNYDYMDIYGLIHRNFVYNGKAVTITAKEALEDTAESGFIIPLHYGIFQDTGIVDATQMSTACCFLVLNSYEEVKQPWYASGFFKIILVVVIAVVSAVFTGGAGIGLLGANFAVGSALGFSGLTATIIGSVANALAAVMISTIIEKVATGIFGELIGGIIAAVLGFFVFSSIGSLTSGNGIAINWGNLMKVDNLMKIADVLGKGYTAWVQSDIQNMAQDTKDYAEAAKSQIEDITNKLLNEFGAGLSVLNPLDLVDSSKIIYESGDTFLKRTLMTGSDFAEMSNDMLTDFADLTLTLPNAFA